MRLTLQQYVSMYVDAVARKKETRGIYRRAVRQYGEQVFHDEVYKRGSVSCQNSGGYAQSYGVYIRERSYAKP